MDLYHVETAILADLSCLSVRFDDLIDHLPGHLLNSASRRHFITYAPCLGASILITADTGKTAVLSAVGKLDVRICPGVVNRARRIAKSLPYTEGIKLQLFITSSLSSGIGVQSAIFFLSIFLPP